MLPFLIFYCIFSYLFVLGVAIESDNLPFWNVCLSPLVMPVMLGKLVVMITKR